MRPPYTRVRLSRMMSRRIGNHRYRIRPASGTSVLAGTASATADALARSCVSDSSIRAIRYRPSAACARGAQRTWVRRSCRWRPRNPRARAAQRRLAREELRASLLRREARRQARGAVTRATRVGQFPCAEPAAEVPFRRLGQESLDAAKLDRVDPAAFGSGGRVRHRARRARARERRARRWCSRSRGR